MYKASITYDIGTDNESGEDEVFASLQSAVEWLNRLAIYGSTVTAHINNKRVRISSAKTVVGDDGLPFCTNPEWHELITDSQPEYPPVRPYNPGGYVCRHNPATLIAFGVDLVDAAAERAEMRQIVGGAA